MLDGGNLPKLSRHTNVMAETHTFHGSMIWTAWMPDSTSVGLRRSRVEVSLGLRASLLCPRAKTSNIDSTRT